MGTCLALKVQNSLKAQLRSSWNSSKHPAADRGRYSRRWLTRNRTINDEECSTNQHYPEITEVWKVSGKTDSARCKAPCQAPAEVPACRWLTRALLLGALAPSCGTQGPRPPVSRGQSTSTVRGPSPAMGTLPQDPDLSQGFCRTNLTVSGPAYRPGSASPAASQRRAARSCSCPWVVAVLRDTGRLKRS